MKRAFTTTICILVFMNGCSVQPVGQVDPTPRGCISMEFFSSSDDSRCKRDESGKITSIVSPIGRTEPLVKEWTWEAFETAISDDDGGDPLSNYLPGPVAWVYVKKHVQPGDEIWTFGFLDTGFLVIRDGRLFCMVVTEHPM